MVLERAREGLGRDLDNLSEEARLLSEDPNMVPAWVYGTVHLLRLFVKLGGMLTYTRLGEKSVQFLLLYINNLMNYLKRNASTLFSIPYIIEL